MAALAQDASFGVVGLGVMGSMLALNLAEKTGENIAGFELDPSKAKAAEAKATKEGLGSAFKAYTDLKEFVNALTTPRRIVMLVPAGKPVDSALAALGPLLDRGDCVVDGGNEWYENTERRAAQFSALGLHYVGCGVSGGAEGARHGPSLMAGGPREAFDLLEPTLKKIAAQVDGPCLGYFGSGGAGDCRCPKRSTSSGDGDDARRRRDAAAKPFLDRSPPRPLRAPREVRAPQNHTDLV